MHLSYKCTLWKLKINILPDICNNKQVLYIWYQADQGHGPSGTNTYEKELTKFSTTLINKLYFSLYRESTLTIPSSTANYQLTYCTGCTSRSLAPTTLKSFPAGTHWSSLLHLLFLFSLNECTNIQKWSFRPFSTVALIGFGEFFLASWSSGITDYWN